MYWPTGSARVLSTTSSIARPPPYSVQRFPPAEQSAEYEVLEAKRSKNGTMFVTITRDELAVWTIRPMNVVAKLRRTVRSVEEYGTNVRVQWKPDASVIVIETTSGFLITYTLTVSRTAPVYTHSALPPAATASFSAGSGEGDQTATYLLSFRLVIKIDAGLECSLATDDYLIVSTRSPPAVQCIPWRTGEPARTNLLSRLSWLERGSSSVTVVSIVHDRPTDLFVWLASDGKAYFVTFRVDAQTAIWKGYCFHGLRPANSSGASTPAAGSTSSLSTAVPGEVDRQTGELPPTKRGAVIAANARLSLIAVGLQDGTINVYTYRSPFAPPPFSHVLSVRQALKSTASYLNTGPVRSLAWTSDGFALAVGWEKGWATWSAFGKLMGCSLREDLGAEVSGSFKDVFMFGIKNLFWIPGNNELVVLRLQKEGFTDPDSQLFCIPFAKSAVAGQHSPDNTQYAFIQLEDRVLVYRGADQPDMSIIDPESDVWHHIKIPKVYIAQHWPIRYAAISSDGGLIAVAGRHGLTHYSAVSGHWKLFTNEQQENGFYVRGGLQWFQHVLVAAVEANGQHQIRLYSRDLDLDNSSILHLETLPSSIILTSLFDNSLLVYTADNTFYHYLIVPTADTIKLRLCGSITFDGVVGSPARVRGMSWMIPPAQQRFGDPVDDLAVATIIFLIDGKLVLLRPRRSAKEEVKYDMQILADKIEYYWTHLQGIGTLENSLWGYDGHGIKVWLDALTIETAKVDAFDAYETIEESLNIPLDFYPLCVLMDKGIIIGVDPEISIRRSLDFATFRTNTNTHLFLHHVLRYHLECSQVREAVLFASHYEALVYFAHALEILLHAVLEDEADAGYGNSEYARLEKGGIIRREISSGSIVEQDEPADGGTVADAKTNGHERSADGGPGAEQQQSTTPWGPHAVLPRVVEFLDHFVQSRQVVVGCARKTEVARWAYLFDVVGKPKDLFEQCLEANQLKTAASYLLVLHNLEQLDESSKRTARLLQRAMETQDWTLCKELLRFLRSIDDTGHALRQALQEAELLEPDVLDPSSSLNVPTLAAPVLFNRTVSAPLPPLVDRGEEEEEEDDVLPELALNGVRSISTGTNMPYSASESPGYYPYSPGGAVSPRAYDIVSGRRGSPGLGLMVGRVGLRSSSEHLPHHRPWAPSTERHSPRSNGGFQLTGSGSSPAPASSPPPSDGAQAPPSPSMQRHMPTRPTSPLARQVLPVDGDKEGVDDGDDVPTRTDTSDQQGRRWM